MPRISKANTKNRAVKKLTLPKSLQEAFLDFIENHPAKRFSRNLHKMVIAHMIQETYSSSPYMKDVLLDLEGLFYLLEAIEEEGLGVENQTVSE